MIARVRMSKTLEPPGQAQGTLQSTICTPVTFCTSATHPIRCAGNPNDAMRRGPRTAPHRRRAAHGLVVLRRFARAASARWSRDGRATEGASRRSTAGRRHVVELPSPQCVLQSEVEERTPPAANAVIPKTRPPSPSPARSRPCTPLRDASWRVIGARVRGPATRCRCLGAERVFTLLLPFELPAAPRVPWKSQTQDVELQHGSLGHPL
jgi:hypothetical protein